MLITQSGETVPIHALGLEIDDAETLANELINNIRANIESIIAVGSQGIVFQLDNGNVLKVLKTRKTSIQPSLNDYKKMQRRQASGKGSPNEPVVYETGQFNVSGKKIGYVEMQKLTVLSDVLADKGWNFDDALDELWLEGPKSWSKILVNHGIPPIVAKCFVDSLKTYIKQTGRNALDELHSDNVGIIETHDKSKPYVFVFFDV